MELTRLLSETWANVVKIARVFGGEDSLGGGIHHPQATNDGGNPSSVTKKTYNTRGGVKERPNPDGWRPYP